MCLSGVFPRFVITGCSSFVSAVQHTGQSRAVRDRARKNLQNQAIVAGAVEPCTVECSRPVLVQYKQPQQRTSYQR